MGFNCGIVGMPNVGKSTLFNALTSTVAAEAANYPFCTIEPNKGMLGVPDDRLYKLAAIAKSEKTIPTQMEFIDIAGLVKGASQGEGLGNKFLSHIREVDAIIHVLRCFDNGDITHVEGSVDPERDAEIIETELILADLESLEKRLPQLEKKANSSGDKVMKAELEIMKAVKKHLDKGDFAREVLKEGFEFQRLKNLNLITSKPLMYVLNVDEASILSGNNYTKKIELYAKNKNIDCVIISSKIEEEISNLDSEDDKKEFIKDIGLEETGLAKIIKSGYNLLSLTTFFTIGPKEARAWTVKTGAKAPEAAGVIHTDFEKGFIRAETIAYEDFIKFNGETGCKDAGKMRLEGKEYLVKDGDVLHFRFNV
jgi:GTP-binding protein YchF